MLLVKMSKEAGRQRPTHHLAAKPTSGTPCPSARRRFGEGTVYSPSGDRQSTQCLYSSDACRGRCGGAYFFVSKTTVACGVFFCPRRRVRAWKISCVLCGTAGNGAFAEWFWWWLHSPSLRHQRESCICQCLCLLSGQAANALPVPCSALSSAGPRRNLGNSCSSNPVNQEPRENIKNCCNFQLCESETEGEPREFSLCRFR